MPVDLSALNANAKDFLISRRWQNPFDPQTLFISRLYANLENVHNIQIACPEDEDLVIIHAKVKGSSGKIYFVLIDFYLDDLEDFESPVDVQCSCPVKTDCKHAAAVLVLLTDQLLGQSQTSSGQITPHLADWLRKIEIAAKTADVALPEKPTDQRFLACCLEEPMYQYEKDYFIRLRVGNLLKSGAISILDSAANADPSNPPKYMTEQDIPLASLYYRIKRRQNGWNGITLNSEACGKLLKLALALGNFYFCENPKNSSRQKIHHRLNSGPALKIEAIWENSADGMAQPLLRCEVDEVEILPVTPLYYFDRRTFSIGLLLSELPVAVLHAWAAGPKVSSDQVEAVAAHIFSVPKVSLPTPSKTAVETREATLPQPYLRVHMTAFPGDGRNMTFGELTFRYGDSQRLIPLLNGGLEKHNALIGNKRITWPRNFLAERALERNLRDVGFISSYDLIPSIASGIPLQNLFLPENPRPSLQLAWLELLDSPAMEGLRAAGWNIEVEPQSGLTAHDAGEFFPTIEADPDHGIDWFRFDASYEFKGKKLSLIPIIAHAIQSDLPAADDPDLPKFFTLPCEDPADGFIRFPTRRLIELVDQVRHLFLGHEQGKSVRFDRLAAAGIADALAIDTTETMRALAKLGHNLRNIAALPSAEIPKNVHAELRPYQADGYRWLQFLAAHGLNGILADDMGLGKTVQTLTHLAAEVAKNPGKPTLVIAPTSVVPNWADEAKKFTPHLKVLTLQGKERTTEFAQIATADVVLTSYPLLTRDFKTLAEQEWHLIVLDEAQYIKNPKALSAQNACKLKSAHRICLSGTPMENHLGELWSLMRFLMPGFLADEKTFNAQLRRPIERDRNGDAQLALNRRVSPLILRRTKDQVATELPPKTEIIHGIDLNKKQTDLYESVRAAMDQRVRDAINAKGLAKSHIIVLDALLKLRQICCHPQLLKTPSAQKVTDSAKLEYLTHELLPTLIEEGRRILLFSTFTSMLALIEKHLIQEKIPFLKLTGQTQDRASLTKKFHTGEIPIFLISLKAGGTGLNLTAADTVIHYDPWWNPAAENQATDRAHRIGQTKPVFVHKLICRGTIEERILELQKHKARLVEALLSEETSKLKIDAETLSHLLAPLD